jgi:uncharacterized membrane protein
MDLALHRAAIASVWMAYNVGLNTIGLAILMALTPPAGRAGRLLVPSLACMMVVLGSVGAVVLSQPRVLVLAAGVAVIAVASLVEPIRRLRAFGWIVTALAILFLPNAAYSISHGVHWIQDIDARGASMWSVYTAGTLYAAYVAYSLLMFQGGLWLLTHRVREAGHRRGGLVVTILGASSVAVYLGRVERFNSWDPLTDPHMLANLVASLVPLWQLWAASAVFAAMLAVVVVTLPAVSLPLTLLRGPVAPTLPPLDRSTAGRAGLAFTSTWLVLTAGYVGLWWCGAAFTHNVGDLATGAHVATSAVAAIMFMVAGVRLARHVNDLPPARRTAAAIACAAVVVAGGIATHWVVGNPEWPRYDLGHNSAFER